MEVIQIIHEYLKEQGIECELCNLSTRPTIFVDEATGSGNFQVDADGSIIQVILFVDLAPDQPRDKTEMIPCTIADVWTKLLADPDALPWLAELLCRPFSVATWPKADKAE